MDGVVDDDGTFILKHPANNALRRRDRFPLEFRTRGPSAISNLSVLVGASKSARLAASAPTSLAADSTIVFSNERKSV